MRQRPNNRSDLSSFATTFNPPPSQEQQLSPIEEHGPAPFGRPQQSFDSVVGNLPPDAAKQSGDDWPDQPVRVLRRSNAHSAAEECSGEPHVANTSKKAAKRRKRQAPPGPAGVLFQTQRHSKQQKGNPNEEVDSTQGQGDDSTKRDDENSLQVEDISSCPAWMCMQLSLGLSTPFLSAYYGTRERYEHLRKNLSSEHVLLPEIHRGLYDLRLSSDKSLVVSVHAIQCHGHFDWTVELRDECGARIRAWLEPKLVQREQEESRYVRVGVVWCLKDVTMAVTIDDTTPEGTSSVERLLLVSEDNIVQTWTPQQAANEIDDKAFLDWMHKRASFLDGECDQIRQEERDRHQAPTTAIVSRTTVDNGNNGFVPNTDPIIGGNSARRHDGLVLHPSTSSRTDRMADKSVAQSQSNIDVSPSCSTPSLSQTANPYASAQPESNLRSSQCRTLPDSDRGATLIQSQREEHVSPRESLNMAGTMPIVSNLDNREVSDLNNAGTVTTQNVPDSEHAVDATNLGLGDAVSRNVGKRDSVENESSEQNVSADRAVNSGSDHSGGESEEVQLGSLHHKAVEQANSASGKHEQDKNGSTWNKENASEQAVEATSDFLKTAADKDGQSTAKNQKAPFTLWTMQGDSEMDLMEEDENGQHASDKVETVQGKDSSQAKDSGNSKHVALGHCGTFDGINVDDLFDED